MMQARSLHHVSQNHTAKSEQKKTKQGKKHHDLSTQNLYLDLTI